MAPYLIVALDGGGVRYILQLVLLRRLLARFPALEPCIRLVAGSSAGALVGTSLVVRGFARTYADMMCDAYARAVFAQSWRRDVYSAHGWYAASYTNTALGVVLRDHYSESPCRRIGDIAASRANVPDLLVTAFCVVPSDADDSGAQLPAGEWCPRVYHTLDRTGAHGHVDTPLLTTLLQTSAAPTYFPVHAGCVDGGVLANNPSMLAVSHALRYGHATLDEMRVLSLGTGVYPSNLNAYGSEADLGKSQWLPHLADLFIEANAEATALNCANLLGDAYCRVQMRLPRQVQLNDADAVATLAQWADEFDLSTTFAWVCTHFPDMEPAT